MPLQGALPVSVRMRGQKGQEVTKPAPKQGLPSSRLRYVRVRCRTLETIDVGPPVLARRAAAPAELHGADLRDVPPDVNHAAPIAV